MVEHVFSLELHLYDNIIKLEGGYRSIKDILGIAWASVGLGIKYIEVKNVTTGESRASSGSFPGLTDLMEILKDFE